MDNTIRCIVSSIFFAIVVYMCAVFITGQWDPTQMHWIARLIIIILWSALGNTIEKDELHD